MTDSGDLRPLGRSGLRIRPFAFGGNVFGWSADESATFALLDALTAAGFGFIDTADAYPAWVPGNRGGESETLIGRWLARRGRRDDVVIATKVAKWSERPGLSPDNIARAADDSLRRLQVDVIDVYFAHEDDPRVPIEDVLGAFSRLIEQGKVRTIGASNFSAPRLAESLEVAARHGLPRYEVLQPEYNLYDRMGYEAELEPMAQEHGLGVVCYYALASGFLSGKYRRPEDAARSAARGSTVVGKYLNPRGERILAALDDIAAARRATPAQVALAWLVARPSVTAPIASATTTAQLDELLAAATLALSADEVATLDAASADR